MKITAPNKQYTGVSASVSFANGEGHTDDPRLIKWFQEHGYTVEDMEELPTDPVSNAGEEQQKPAKKADAKRSSGRKKGSSKDSKSEDSPDDAQKTDDLNAEDNQEDQDAMPDPEGEDDQGDPGAMLDPEGEQ